MTARRWQLPAAVVAALLIAEGAVLALRPEEKLEPVVVSESRYFKPAELERARTYASGQRLLGLGAIAAQGIVLVLLVRRPPRRMLRWATHEARGRVVVATALAGGALALAVTAAALPFGLWAHERAVEFGKSTQSLGGWLEDRGKETAIAVSLAALGAIGFAALMRRFPRGWWVAGAGAVVALEVVFVWLGPVVLDPVFNRYNELPQGQTRLYVEQVARKAGVEVGDVMIVDASRRTTGANAYVAGLGHTKRVVLYDTLLRRFTADQVRLVVAHEFAHVKHRDLARGMLWVALVAPGAMLVVMLLTRRWSERARTVPGTPASLPAFALALALVSFTAMVVSNQLSRAVEARADATSLELAGLPHEFVSLERQLARANLSDPEPPALYRFLFATHPSVMQRIGAGLAYDRRREVSGGAESAGAAGDAPR